MVQEVKNPVDQIVEEIKKDKAKWMEKRKIGNYKLEVTKFTESMESYYWDLLTVFNVKIGDKKMSKIGEEMGATVVSGFFGDIIARRSKIEEYARTYLASINTVVKSIITLLYELRELDRRVNVYKDYESKDPEKKKAADSALKRVFIDEVDIKKGNASINSLSSSPKYGFFQLRDAFMAAQSIEHINKIGLNERVKRILLGRYEEYINWVKESAEEMKNRRKIELAYLKAQVESLDIYSQWATPYLKAAQMLQFKDVSTSDLSRPDVINAFDQAFYTINIRAKKAWYITNFKRGKGGIEYEHKLPEEIPEAKAQIEAEKGQPVYGVFEAKLTYTVTPTFIVVEQRRSPINIGSVKIELSSYMLTQDEVNALEKTEKIDVLKYVEGLTSESLTALRKDIAKYLDEFDKENKVKEGTSAEKILPKEKKEENKSKPISEVKSFWDTIKENDAKKQLEYLKKLVKPEIKKLFDEVYDLLKKKTGLMAKP